MDDPTPESGGCAARRAALSPDEVGGLTEIPLYKPSGRGESNPGPPPPKSTEGVSTPDPLSSVMSDGDSDPSEAGADHGVHGGTDPDNRVRHFVRHFRDSSDSPSELWWL